VGRPRVGCNAGSVAFREARRIYGKLSRLPNISNRIELISDICIRRQIIQTFFVSAISGGISAELTNILEKPSAIIDLLANSLPAQSSYFMQILLASTFLLQAVEFLRAYQLGLALVRRFIGPNLTKKERRKTWGFLNSLEDPPEFWHAETFAQILLYFVVFLVYATIAPVTSFFLCFCFILLESGYRFQFIHNYPRAYDTGGKLYYSFIQFTLASIIIAQLTVVGLLILKQNKFAGPALGPLIAITISKCSAWPDSSRIYCI